MPKVERPKKVVTGLDIGSTVNSSAIEVGPYEAGALHIKWTTSDVNGTITIQANATDESSLSWDTFTDGTDDIEISLSGSSGNEIFLMERLIGIDKVRVAFANVSGSDGSLDVWLAGVVTT